MDEVFKNIHTASRKLKLKTEFIKYSLQHKNIKSGMNMVSEFI